jgi:rRNA maturation endonuclease Nob1
MGVLDDVVHSAKNAADFLGNKTGEIVEITKLRTSIAEVESKLYKEYQSLGKFAYDAHKSNSDFNEIITEKSAAIDELNAQLAELNLKLSDLKGEIKCEVCGTINDENSNFCKKCGAPLHQKQQ